MDGHSLGTTSGESYSSRLQREHVNKGGKFLKKLWCWVGGRV